jgi:hypothetical protein
VKALTGNLVPKVWDRLTVPLSHRGLTLSQSDRDCEEVRERESNRDRGESDRATEREALLIIFKRVRG